MPALGWGRRAAIYRAVRANQLGTVTSLNQIHNERQRIEIRFLGQPDGVGPVTPDAGPRCAAHPEVVAIGPCVRCGTFVCANCQRGTSSLSCEKCWALEREGTIPWDQREKLGLPRAFLLTWWGVMSGPRGFFRRLGPGSEVRGPILFGIAALAASHVVGILINFGQIAVSEGNVAAKQQRLVSTLIDSAKALPFVPLGLVLGVLLIHFGCRLWTVHTHGLRGTVRVYSYSLSVSLLGPLGCFAGKAAPAASVALSGFQLALVAVGFVYAFGAPPRRLLGAALVGPAGFLCCFVALYNFFSKTG